MRMGCAQQCVDQIWTWCVVKNITFKILDSFSLSKEGLLLFHLFFLREEFLIETFEIDSGYPKDLLFPVSFGTCPPNLDIEQACSRCHFQVSMSLMKLCRWEWNYKEENCVDENETVQVRIEIMRMGCAQQREDNIVLCCSSALRCVHAVAAVAPEAPKWTLCEHWHQIASDCIRWEVGGWGRDPKKCTGRD